MKAFCWTNKLAIVVTCHDLADDKNTYKYLHSLPSTLIDF